MSSEIEIKSGKIVGAKEDKIMVFKGIPYAAAPVGDLRFKRAKKHPGWEGTLDCTKFRAKCWQFGGGKFQHSLDSDTEASEDCLFLNIWTKDVKEKKPVFVWIHGGGQYCGEASSSDYDLSSFAKNDIVGVSFNYRLGVLGFYDFSAYDSAFESNCAVSDMLMALKWVRENIEVFGGDPNNVTLCGESAGATCVMALLACEEARGYYNRAIIMSGVLNNLLAKQVKDYNNDVFFRMSGISKDNIMELMNADYETLLKGCACRFDGSLREKPGMLTSGPVIDDLITESPIAALLAGKLADKEIMVGTCRDEGGIFEYFNLGFESFDKAMDILRRNGYEDRIELFEEAYEPGQAGSAEEREACVKFNTDLKFFPGAVKLASAAAKYSDVYMYRFDYDTPISRLIKAGATHSMDVAAAFNVKGSTLYKFALNDGGVKENLHGAFVNFIKYGNPNELGDKSWFKYEDKNKATMLVDNKMTLTSGPREEFYYLWENLEID